MSYRPFTPALLGVLALLGLGRAHAAPTALPATSAEQVLTLPLADGVLQRVLIVAPLRPRAAIVMLPGGSGDVGIARGGDIRHDDNFVVRTRDLWVARGFAVLIPDTIERANLRGLRSSPDYARLVDDLADYARANLAPRVFLLGTSQGAIAAMNGAAHARPNALAGVVLTEPVSVVGASHETVFDADPQAVRIPALVVANRDDQCTVAPPALAPRIAAAMTSSPDVKLDMVAGGATRSDKACGSLTPHGYYGIEPQVVDRIARWMDATR